MKTSKLPFEKIKKMNDDGLSIKEISKLYGTCEETIRKMFILNNLQYKPGKSKNIDENSLDNITTNTAYLLGLLCSDGSIDKDGYGFQICSKDLEIVKSAKTILNSNHKIVKISSFDKRSGKIYEKYNIHFCSKKLTSHLRKLGLNNNKSFDCKMPPIPENYFWDFIRGLFDGDGSISSNKDNYNFTLIASSEIMNEIKIKFKEIELSDTKLSIVSKNEKGIIYRIKQNSNSDLLKIYDKLYSSNPEHKLERKFKKFSEIKMKIPKEIKCKSLKEKNVNIFKTNREVSKFTGLSESMICSILKGKRKSAKFEIWI